MYPRNQLQRHNAKLSKHRTEHQFLQLVSEHEETTDFIEVGYLQKQLNVSKFTWILHVRFIHTPERKLISSTIRLTSHQCDVHYLHGSNIEVH